MIYEGLCGVMMLKIRHFKIY